MSLELLLSSLLTTALMSMAYLCRRSFASVHLVSLGLFCTALPLLWVLFGVSPWPASDEALLFTYGGVALYAGSMFLGSLALGGRGLVRVTGWLRNMQPKGRSTRVSILIFLVLWTIRIYKGAAYGIVYSGSGTGTAVEALPYWLSTLESVVSLLGGGALVMLSISAVRGGGRWLWIFVVLELVWVFVSGGRRDVVFLSVVIAWVAWQARVVRLPTMVAMLAIVGMLLYVATPLFLIVRDYNADYQHQGVPTFAALKYAISDGYTHCGIGLRCSDMTKENIASRGNAMEFTKSVVSAQGNGYLFLFGAGLLNSLSWAIPSVILPKPELMTEQFVQSSFGLPLVDDAISVPALAYADLGLLGSTFAGICVAIFVRLFAQFSLRQSIDLLALSMSYGLARVIWNIESDPLSYVVLLRDSVLLVLMIKAFVFFRRLKVGR